MNDSEVEIKNSIPLTKEQLDLIIKALKNNSTKLHKENQKEQIIKLSNEIALTGLIKDKIISILDNNPQLMAYDIDLSLNEAKLIWRSISLLMRYNNLLLEKEKNEATIYKIDEETFFLKMINLHLDSYMSNLMRMQQ